MIKKDKFNRMKWKTFVIGLSLFLLSCNKNDKESSSCSISIAVGSGTEKKAGITVVKRGNATEGEANKVKDQITQLMKGTSCRVKDLFANKKIIIGVLDNESHDDLESFFAKRKATGYDGVEIIYTDPAGDGNDSGNTRDNETNTNTFCQKIMQIFDYYVADKELDEELTEAYLDIKNSTGVDYNNCEAYGNAAQNPPCPQDSKGAERDEAHPANIDLNPGAVLGKMCEYELDPSKWVPPNEFRGTLNTDYKLTDPAFNKIKTFLKTHFGVSQSVN